MTVTMSGSRAVLLRRRRKVIVERTEPVAQVPESLLQAVDLELANLGFAVSTRLRNAFSRIGEGDLAALQRWCQETLAAEKGADREHVPLFRSFPAGVPEDTLDLWIRKVLNHFLQGEDQPCLFCGNDGTTHVLRPCQHVVCGACFDGSNYSACPVCEHHVDRSSPFFTATDFRDLPNENVRLVRLDLCEDVESEMRELFEGYCARLQPMTPDDVGDLRALVEDYGEHLLPWLPQEIPVKENVAHVMGTLLRIGAPGRVVPAIARFARTATDVLRIIASYSDADPALQGGSIYHALNQNTQVERFWGPPRELAQAALRGEAVYPPQLSLKVHRFKVGRLSRSLRRTLLELLNGLDENALTEDMLRHRSYWVWVGEFLHPHEYSTRYPKVARAFAVVRKKGPDGTPAPSFQTYYSKLESAAAQGDALKMISLLEQRPGELARRFDHVLRVAGDDAGASAQAIAAFEKHAHRFSTPVLCTLHGFLPKRGVVAPVRVYWPKEKVSKGVAAEDTRPPLRADVIAPATRVVEEELLKRFSEQPRLEDCVIDTALGRVVAPFNERTASPSAVNLPRGSILRVPTARTVRLFLHWCEPEDGNTPTDLDLSVGFYSKEWAHVGVCSYYQLQCGGFAKSAGDLRDAPFPDGASEFVDVNVGKARTQGVRYAVMVVNAYSGLSFGELDLAFAGLMFRDDIQGAHFDPRSVHLKFDLQGANGVFLPLVLDLETQELHWLDAYDTGEFSLNNVESSNNAIQTICPNLMSYFGSGVRISMFELACLHAAARSQRAYLRDPEGWVLVERGTGTVGDFLGRLRAAEGQGIKELPDLRQPAMGALLTGDLPIQADAGLYALFPGRVTGDLAASDLLV